MNSKPHNICKCTRKAFIGLPFNQLLGIIVTVILVMVALHAANIMISKIP